ncbi:ABC-2 transporter permease [Clostridium estertheticum]|uniref:ABC-2 transporter permease n=1 Tax=Clostridium estertheticum TaxID=238834 RepID=UPI001CF38433|nr:ABC-2 transporter permease [Clostridium estertheticum]MCB2359141.1 ABC-2 transporter permease [Clostridium estertheticum]
MKELMYKEFKLSMQPIAYILLSLSLLLCIPNYPYYVTFFYTCLGIFFVFQINRENRDVYYMIALPIRKRDIVKARFYLVVCIELAQVITCIPFAFIRDNFIPMNNQVGIEANVAFIGLSFIMLGLFNFIFLTQYYKSGYKIGVPFLKSTTMMVIYIVIAEFMLRVIPYMRDYCDSVRIEDQIKQIPVLILGIILYIVITFLAYKKSADSFDKLDL